MTAYQYRVIPAPTKGRKAPGVKGADAKFAHALQEVINQAAAEGWEYQRSDILPSEERQGLTSSHTVYRSVLVFRRPASAAAKPEDAPVATEETPDIEPGETPEEPKSYEDSAETENAQDTPPSRP